MGGFYILFSSFKTQLTHILQNFTLLKLYLNNYYYWNFIFTMKKKLEQNNEVHSLIFNHSNKKFNVIFF